MYRRGATKVRPMFQTDHCAEQLSGGAGGPHV